MAKFDVQGTLAHNSIHAQLERGKTEQCLSFGMARLAGTLGKPTADVVLFSSQNFDFLKLPDEFTTRYSIMPHKKKPDVFELIRGRCNLLQSLPTQVSLLTGNLTSGYHRDFQLLKEGGQWFVRICRKAKAHARGQHRQPLPSGNQTEA